MTNDEDFLTIYSDIIKGKISHPDHQIVKVSWEGEMPPPLPSLLTLSETFEEIAAEYITITKALSQCSLFSTAALIGGLLTLPELQSNCIRLEALAHLVAMTCKGKKRVTPGQLSAWFKQMDKGTCGRLEDRAEDVFIANVGDSQGNYLLFEGVAEGNAFHVQIMLNVLESMPDTGWFHSLRNSVNAILRLSTAIAVRAGLSRNITGKPIPQSEIPLVKESTLGKIRGYVTFTTQELITLGIDVEDLAPFIFNEEATPEIAAGIFANSILEACPLIASGEKIAVILPSIIGVALRRLIIESCIVNKVGKTFEKTLAQCYAEFFHNELLFNAFKNAPLIFHKIENVNSSSLVRRIDEGRYLHFVFFCDGIADYEVGTFAGIHSPEEPTKVKENVPFVNNR